MSVSHYDIAVTADGEGSATFVGEDGEFVTVPSSHPNFERVTDALVQGTDPTKFLSVVASLKAFAEEVDARVTFEDGQVLFAGEPVHSALADTILRYGSEGRDTKGLVRFLERLQQNPSENSRAELWTWIERQGLSVTDDGCFLAFKGVEPNYDSNAAQFPYRSKGSGTAWVDGVKFEGQIPNKIGAVITMPRKDVDDNTRVECSNGLHVGTYRYASTFATILLEVKVAPEDVVSVPVYDTNKLRCQRYEVLAVQERKSNDLSSHEPEKTWTPEALADALANEDVPRSFLDKLLRRKRNKDVDTADED